MTEPVPAHDVRVRSRTWMAAHGALAIVAGLLLAALLLILAPSSIQLRVAEPVTGLLPMTVTGVHGVEENYGHMIRWTTGQARLRWSGQFGVEPARLRLSLAGFPGRQPDSLELRVNGHVSRHAVPVGYDTIDTVLPSDTEAPLDIAIATLTTRPPGDPRDLGVRLESVTIENLGLAARMRAALRAGTAGIVALGALVWVGGWWAAGRHASTSRRLAAACGAWVATALLAWLVAAAALRTETWVTVPPAVLGIVTALLLVRAGHRRAVAGAAGLIVALQAVVAVTWFSSAFVDVPRWDIWDIVPLLAKVEQHGLTLHDLWMQHNEHRPTVARAVLLANVALSRWNHWNELWAMLLITAGHYLVYVAAIRHAGRRRGGAATIVALAAVGTFVATATQWENFLQGWQVALILGAMAISAAFVVLTSSTVTWPRLAGAAALVFLGTAGFASCLIGWPLGAITIAVRRGPGWRGKCAAWIGVGVAVGVAYVHGLQRPGGLPPPEPIFTSLDAAVRVAYGAFMALAMPIWYAPMSFSDTTSLAWWLLPTLGAAGTALGVALLAVHVWREETRREQAWLLPALLMAFALAACGMTAYGRVSLGMHAMTASRYIVFTGLFWIGLVLLLTVAAPFRSAFGRRAGIGVALLIVGAGLRGWVDSLPYIEAHYVSGSIARDALLRGDIGGTLVLFPVPPVLDERQQFLRKRQLSLFRPGAR